MRTAAGSAFSTCVKSCAGKMPNWAYISVGREPNAPSGTSRKTDPTAASSHSRPGARRQACAAKPRARTSIRDLCRAPGTGQVLCDFTPGHLVLKGPQLGARAAKTVRTVVETMSRPQLIAQRIAAFLEKHHGGYCENC